MSAVIGIVSQIAEAERELALRHNVYRKQLDAKTITQEQANLLIGRMEAIIKTLRFVQTHEAGFREFIAARKDNPSSALRAPSPQRGEEKETGLGPRGDDDVDIAAKLKKAVAGLAGAEFIIASQIEEVNLALQL